MLAPAGGTVWSVRFGDDTLIVGRDQIDSVDSPWVNRRGSGDQCGYGVRREVSRQTGRRCRNRMPPPLSWAVLAIDSLRPFFLTLGQPQALVAGALPWDIVAIQLGSGRGGDGLGVLGC
jgi:hypothetical protein